MIARIGLAAGLMLFAGAAWGLYSLRGRGAGAPLKVTAGNFLRATDAHQQVIDGRDQRAQLRMIGIEVDAAAKPPANRYRLQLLRQARYCVEFLALQQVQHE